LPPFTRGERVVENRPGMAQNIAIVIQLAVEANQPRERRPRPAIPEPIASR